MSPSPSPEIVGTVADGSILKALLCVVLCLAMLGSYVALARKGH